MEDLTKLSGPELANVMEELNLSESGCTRGYAIVEAVQAYLRNDDRIAMRNLERERDGLRERVRELDAERSAALDENAVYELKLRASEQDRDERAAWKQRAEDAEKRIAELEVQPAERKAQEERRYGGGSGTGYTPMTLNELLSMYDRMSAGSPIEAALSHLRETLATLDAVRVFANTLMSEGRETISLRLSEVLNGKR